MSSLRRLLSLECADASPPPLHLPSSRRTLARHSSFPPLSLYKAQGLTPLPCQRSCRYGTLLGSPTCAYNPDGTHRKLASCRSVPAWPSYHEGELHLQAITRFPARKESAQMEDSVVYRELCESIHLFEMPQRIGCMLNAEAASCSSVQDESKSCTEVEEISDARGRPLSLRRLKRNYSAKSMASPTFSSNGQASPCYSLGRQVEEGSWLSTDKSGRDDGRKGLLSDVTGSVNCAIATLVFMMESLQEQTLRLRKSLTTEVDMRLHAIMEKVHQEMQETFLWLFQQVFACTPQLMLLTMMLLVDFAAHSMGQHVALAVMPMGEPPTLAIESAITSSTASVDEAINYSRMNPSPFYAARSNDTGIRLEPCPCEGGAGNGVVRVAKLGGAMDDKAALNVFADRAAFTPEDDSHVGLNNPSEALVFGQYSLSKSDTGKNTPSCFGEEQCVLNALWEQAISKELSAVPLLNARHILVAPVQAPALEADDYACYDRTDLKYQQELGRDPSNPLLLANYAQFLHVVRHDHDRAEELYKRAVKSDPVDGELIGKYASFLWVARDNIKAADEAYKAALAVDSSNVYNAGNYAHFLWNLGVEDDDAPSPAPLFHRVSTT